MNSFQTASSGLPCRRMSSRISSGREPPRNTRSRTSAFATGGTGWAACTDQDTSRTSSARQARRIFIEGSPDLWREEEGIHEDTRRVTKKNERGQRKAFEADCLLLFLSFLPS